MTKQLIIIGTGGGALDVLDIVEAINTRVPTWQVIGFLDDAKPVGSMHLGHEIIGPVHCSQARSGRLGRVIEDAYFVNVIGSDRNYRRRAQILGATGLPLEHFVTLVHPSAVVSQ